MLWQQPDWTILMRVLLAAVYVGAMVAANLLVWLSPWFSLIDSVLLIGLDLTLRDVMDERLSRAQLAAVIVGAVRSYGLPIRLRTISRLHRQRLSSLRRWPIGLPIRSCARVRGWSGAMAAMWSVLRSIASFSRCSRSERSRPRPYFCSSPRRLAGARSGQFCCARSSAQGISALRTRPS